jgi:hypothetical protein
MVRTRSFATSERKACHEPIALGIAAALPPAADAYNGQTVVAELILSLRQGHRT